MGRSSFSGWLTLSLWSIAAAAWLAWIAAGAQGWRAAAGLAAVAAGGAWAGWAWWRQPAGLLSWDGGRWTFEGPGPPADGGLVPVLDLQRLLLVRWDAADHAGWLWLERARLPVRWDALRRAVYSRAESGAPSGAKPPSATP